MVYRQRLLAGYHCNNVLANNLGLKCAGSSHFRTSSCSHVAKGQDVGICLVTGYSKCLVDFDLVCCLADAIREEFVDDICVGTLASAGYLPFMSGRSITVSNARQATYHKIEV